jgi:hypothetical protein
MERYTGQPRKALARSLRRLSFAISLAVILLAGARSSMAEVFESRYLRFSLPEGWKCDLEDHVFVCEPPHPKGQKVNKIIMFAVKYPGADDNLSSYMEYLKTNRSTTNGSSLIDGPRIDTDLGAVSWVEATHYESELKGFNTTYLATVSNGLALLVTFSGGKDGFSEFQQMMKPCIRSLEIKKNWRIAERQPGKK